MLFLCPLSFLPPTKKLAASKRTAFVFAASEFATPPARHATAVAPWTQFASLPPPPPPRPNPRGPDSAMKITALLVLKSPGDSSTSASGVGEQQEEAVVLANSTDVSHFGYFQRAAAREFILFVARTAALRTPAGTRQNVQHEGTLRLMLTFASF